MTTVATNNKEQSILDVIRELDAKEVRLKAADKAAPQEGEVDPAKLRESLREKLEIVSIVKKTRYAHLIEGSCGKSIGEIQKELQTALSDLDELGKSIEVEN